MRSGSCIGVGAGHFRFSSPYRTLSLFFFFLCLFFLCSFTSRSFSLYVLLSSTTPFGVSSAYGEVVFSSHLSFSFVKRLECFVSQGSPCHPRTSTRLHAPQSSLLVLRSLQSLYKHMHLYFRYLSQMYRYIHMWRASCLYRLVWSVFCWFGQRQCFYQGVRCVSWRVANQRRLMGVKRFLCL